jgi:integrase
MAKTLTTAAVARLKPASNKRRIIRDAGSQSLFLVIQPSGRKSWHMRFRRPGGKAAKLHLGPVDLSNRTESIAPEIGMPLSLAMARRLAARINSERATGRDVIADNKANKHRRFVAEMERSANSFATLARKYIDEHARPNTRRWRATARNLGLRYPPRGEPEKISKGLVSRWGDRPVSEINAHDIYSAINEAHRSAIPGLERKRSKASSSQGRAMASSLSALFGWLLQHRKINLNPCVGTFKPPASRPRDRVLTSAEIVKFWNATDRVNAPYAAALKLLLLTGARMNEILHLRWSEVNEDADELNIPGTRTKNRLAFVIPLARAARAIIDGVPRLSDCEFVFSINARAPITGGSRAKKILDAAMGDVPPWVVHDLRRTAATHMAELGTAPHIVEACLNHISGARASVAGIYNRAAYAREKREALEQWANHITAIVSGVIPIRRQQRQ